MSQESFEIIGFVTAFFVILASFIVGVLLYLRRFRRKGIEFEHEKNLLSEEYKMKLMLAEINSQQQTMQHIGREIHDSVGQKLTLASIYAKQASLNYSKSEVVYKLIDESLQELRVLSKSLTDPSHLQRSMKDLLQSEAERINASGVCYVKVDMGMDTECLQPGQKNTLFRLLQEFIQNSLKHAACRNISVSFRRDGVDLIVTATDDGRGFDLLKHSTGNGLYNMKRRSEELKATMSLNSAPGTGTILLIKIPIFLK